LNRVSFKDVGLKYSLSPDDEPVARIDPGETLVLEIEDTYLGKIRKKGDPWCPSESTFGNPVVGPIYLNGAEKGSTISVAVEEIKPTISRGFACFDEFCENYLAGTPLFTFMEMHLPRDPKIYEIRNGLISFSDNITIPYQPMIGTIGTAPHPELQSMSSVVLPDRHGGNMDLPDIRPGSTVYLPAFHKGALLYVGDVHAAQGDGEISGTAIEIPAEVKIRTDLLQGYPINWPRIENDSEYMSVATTSAGRSLEDAIRTAFMELITWMEDKHGLNRFDGLLLCSHIGRIRLGNLWTVAAKIEKRYLGKHQIN